jgi:hypothetical protein
MSLNVRLTNAMERELDAWCAAHSTTRSIAVKRALTQMLSANPGVASSFELGKDGFGSDTTSGRRVARSSQQTLRREFRGKPAR